MLQYCRRIHLSKLVTMDRPLADGEDRTQVMLSKWYPLNQPGSFEFSLIPLLGVNPFVYISQGQYMYDNGDMGNTFIIINLKYNNNTITTGHNWHVHESPVTSDCASCGPHYNPFMVDMVRTCTFHSTYFL